jgi:hypothetical protein
MATVPFVSFTLLNAGKELQIYISDGIQYKKNTVFWVVTPWNSDVSEENIASTFTAEEYH